LKVFSPEIVYTASFRGNVRLSVPEYWLAISIELLLPITSLATLLVVSHIEGEKRDEELLYHWEGIQFLCLW